MRTQSKRGASPRDVTIVIICSVLIILALFVVLNMSFHWIDLGFLGGRINPGEPRDTMVVVIDEDTLEVHYVKKGKDESYPLENESGQRTLCPAYVCRNENILFLAKPGEVIMACPFCYNMNTGGASKEDMDLEVRPREGYSIR